MMSIKEYLKSVLNGNEKLAKAFNLIEPFIEEIEKDSSDRVKRYTILAQQNHDVLGRVLKCHLILENYLTDYLKHLYPSIKIENLRLSFAQLVNLLPQDQFPGDFISSGLLELNRIRNKFAHNLEFELSQDYLKHIRTLSGIQPNEEKEPIELVEKMTFFCCSLLVAKNKGQDLITETLIKVFADK